MVDTNENRSTEKLILIAGEGDGVAIWTQKIRVDRADEYQSPRQETYGHFDVEEGLASLSR